MFLVDDNADFQTEPVFIEVLVIFVDTGVPFLDVSQIVAIVGRFFDFPAGIFQNAQIFLREVQPFRG